MKYLTLIALALAATTAQADFWDNCTAYGGTIITANSYGNDKSGGLCHDPSDPNVTQNCNGKRFCKNGNVQNWWTSFVWCNEIGGRLASFESVCPGVQTFNSGACPNIKGLNIQCWTSMGWQSNNAIRVQYSGNVNNDYRHNDANTYALCEE